MHLTNTGYALLRRFEGFSATAYRCPAGYLTIGYGHVVRAGEIFSTLTQAQALALLEEDVAHTESAVRRLLPVTLSEGEFDALVSFTYNLGAGALQRSALRAKILRGEKEAAGEEFLRWVHAGGRKLPGLVLRRAAERARYFS